MNAKYSSPKTYTETEWFNPTEDELFCDIYVGPEDNPQPYTRFEFHPGQTTRVPSEYDHAIQKVKDGIIVAGMVPQLKKKGCTARLHPSLNAAEAQRIQALVEAQSALTREMLATQASTIQLAKVKQVEELRKTVHGESDKQSKISK